MGKEREIHEMVGRTVFGAMMHGGTEYHAFKEMLHLLREAGRDVKEVIEETGEEESPRCGK
jgi:hypothetical protein